MADPGHTHGDLKERIEKIHKEAEHERNVKEKHVSECAGFAGQGVGFVIGGLLQLQLAAAACMHGRDLTALIKAAARS